jgi:branched-chain amino acid transport system substrate-binding protein
VTLGVLAAVVVLALGAYFVIQLNTKPAAPHIKVGVMMAFSGGSSSMGYGAMKGVQLAKKQLGADNIDIVQVDSKCDAKTAGEAIKNLINQKVVAIIGEGCSSASVAALPAANNAKIPMISPSASSPTLSIADDYFFRVVPPDNFQGSFMAQAIYDRGIRKVAVFYTNEPYGSGMNTVFREKFEALGGKVVATAFAEPDVIDLSTQMKTLEAAQPEAVFIAPNSVVSATAAMKLAREAGIEASFFGADIMYDNTIISNNPAVAEGLTISSFPTGTKAFKQSLVNEYGKSEQLYAAPQAYDIIHILQLAVQKGATTGEQIKNVLPNITLADSVSGFKHFDTNGEVSDKSYKYDLFQVKDGAFSLVEQ